MQTLNIHQNTALKANPLINRYHDQGKEITPEKIRDAVRAWSASINNQDVVTGIIVEEWERQGGYELDFPADLSRQRQKLFRWLDGCTPTARTNIKLLTPAIMAVLPLEFRGRLAAQDCFMVRFAAMEKELCEAKQALMLNAPQHQVVKEVREGIEKMLAMLPAEAMGQVLSSIAVLAPGVL